MKLTLSRRGFLKSTAFAGIGFWAAGQGGRAASPLQSLNVGCIGVGGMGKGDMTEVAKHARILALCDIDDNHLRQAADTFKAARTYHDFRKMLEKEIEIDAVTVSTPDHTHAPASVMAMRLGRHCFCQKPLTHSIHEARVMRDTAKRANLATQMGTQGVAEDGHRRAIEVMRSGVLGTIREVHVWTDRPRKWWLQGVDRPKETPPVPPHVHWDLWLGVAPERPYHPAYHPFAWRGWFDFGTGAVGDMGCHNAALPFRALELGPPSSAEAETGPVNSETYPIWSIVRFEVAPRAAGVPPIKLTWYDGGKLPPAELIGGKELDGNGSITVGDKGTLYSPDWAGSVFHLFPETTFKEYVPPQPSIPRSPGHYKEWVDACKGGPPAFCNFVDFASPITELMLLGNVAIRAGKKIQWDSANLKATNAPEADRLIRREYREGWRQPELG